MGSTLLAILIVSIIGAGLAGLLVLSESVISNYGLCRIAINDERELTGEGGKDLLSMLTAEKLFIPSACGGRGTCGLCKVRVLEGGGMLLPTEEPYLSKEERADNVRLSCQVKVRNDLKIWIPRELFAIREYVSTCTRIVDLTHDIKLFRLELREPPTMDYIPGQYIQLLTPIYEKSREEVYRAYSIASDPAERGVLDLIIRLVPGGICTTYCFEYLKQGDEVKLNGPHGEFHLTDTDAPIVFIAGGSGMAPIRCMLYHLRNTGSRRKAVYFFGANKVKEMFMMDEMRRFESELPDFRFVPVIAQPDPDETWAGETGLVTHAVQRGLKDAPAYEAYLCGSPGMIDASIKVLLELGVQQSKVFFDKFA